MRDATLLSYVDSLFQFPLVLNVFGMRRGTTLVVTNHCWIGTYLTMLGKLGLIQSLALNGHLDLSGAWLSVHLRMDTIALVFKINWSIITCIIC